MTLDEDLQRVDLVIGEIVSVREHAGARAPSYVLTLDLGPRGERQATIERGEHRADDLAATQVVCALSGDEVLILQARSHAGGAILLQPERRVENGTPVA